MAYRVRVVILLVTNLRDCVWQIGFWYTVAIGQRGDVDVDEDGFICEWQLRLPLILFLEVGPRERIGF